MNKLARKFGNYVYAATDVATAPIGPWLGFALAMAVCFPFPEGVVFLCLKWGLVAMGGAPSMAALMRWLCEFVTEDGQKARRERTSLAQLSAMALMGHVKIRLTKGKDMDEPLPVSGLSQDASLRLLQNVVRRHNTEIIPLTEKGKQFLATM
jgi:hypothetical protein